MRLKKISHFIGIPNLDYKPVLLNSLPKSGTNLLEIFLVKLGYYRAWERCINRSNLKPKYVAKRGRFFVAHLSDDRVADSFTFDQYCSIFVHRRLEQVLRSYINYLFIDKGHPTAKFLASDRSFDRVMNLLFSPNNPFGRPTVEEFTELLCQRYLDYDLVIRYEDFVAGKDQLIDELSNVLGFDRISVVESIGGALSAPSFTKNQGRIDLFSNFTQAQSEVFSQEVARYEH